MTPAKKRTTTKPPDPVAELEQAIRKAIQANVSPPDRKRLARLLQRGY